ncbi:hypothetical protein DFA_10683 [Cavenderia fasciculata]|uniref:Uncharacterized protein n=1 Tax=Cavenderia fasciculata TaxID=261658 RepID=F4QB38_CACFS|nr:uncharacterized protein DFA_10683 [Cavenderia fasciculata]EGG14810.1 hypothetical protein DFA_10683 [Cavenderia fasciculata]|eukprot:XP_004351326.1 hypothetical protein DFA_10683 [Cavenderia fasciculata]
MNLNILVAPPPSEFIDVIVKLAIKREKKKTNKDDNNRCTSNNNNNDNNNNYKQLYNDIVTEKGQEEAVSWLLYLVIKCELSTVCNYNYNESIFNVLISPNNNNNNNNDNDDDDETQTLLISILNILNVGVTDNEYLDYLKLIENTIRNHRDNQVVREIILKIMESIDTKQVQLVATEESIVTFNNIMTSFLTDPSSVQYQLRAIHVIRSKSEIRDIDGRQHWMSIVEMSNYDRYEFYTPQFKFSNDQVIQHLLDLTELSIHSGGNIYWVSFVDYIDPIQYKYVCDELNRLMIIILIMNKNTYTFIYYQQSSSRIFPIMLKLLLYKTGARQKERAVGFIQKIGAKMGMRYFARYLFEMIQHFIKIGEKIEIAQQFLQKSSKRHWRDWNYFSIYLPSIMKSIIAQLNQTQNPKQKRRLYYFLWGMIEDVYPYFHHLVDPIVCHLVNVNMMFLILKVVVAKEGINQNSQLLFDRFMQSLMDPPPSKMKTQPWYLRIKVMVEMIDTMQGGIWTSHQIQVFNKCDNEYCQKLEIISEKEYTDELSENRYKDFESTLVNWIRAHSILFDLCNSKVMQTSRVLLLQQTQTSLDKFITMVPTTFEKGKAYNYFLPSIVCKWELLCDNQKDKVKVVLDYYPKIVPLLLENNTITDRCDGYQYMAKSFWKIIKILVQEQQQQQQQQQQQCQMHLEKIHQMMIDLVEKSQDNHVYLLLQVLWNTVYDEDDNTDGHYECLFNQFITIVDDNHPEKKC